MPAGVQHTSCTDGRSHCGIVVGVADHHTGRRVDAGAAQIVGAKLYLAYAVNVRKAEQLGKKALQTPGGYLLDQVITAGDGKHSLLPAHAGQRLQGVNGVCRYSAAGHTGVVVLHKAGGKLRVGVPRKVEPGAAVVVLDGKAEQLPVGSQIVPLGVAVGLQHPVQAAVGKIHIVHADLSPVVGSEQGGIRPVIVIQNDIGNKYSPTVIVAAITSQINKAKLPTHVEISSEEYGLNRDSVVLLEQLRTLDKKRLKEKIGHMTDSDMRKVNKALLISLNLA